MYGKIQAKVMKSHKRLHPVRELKAGPRQSAKRAHIQPEHHARTGHKPASEVNVSKVYPFGPQSRWSYLVSQRELLQEELDRGKRCLEHLRKDLFECTTVFGSWSGSSSLRTWTATSNQKNTEMEEFFGGWLHLLEENLGSVTKQIDNMVVEAGPAHTDAEESMFALLRAAG
jgi:hypothetical protein